MAIAISPPTPAMPSTTRPPSTAATSTDRPRKKQKRELGDAIASSTVRETQDLETSLEVDHMILDYLLYQATDACLLHTHTSFDKDVSPVETALLSVDDFYALFSRRYPSYRPNPQIQLRRDLLQLTTLFTQRLRRNYTTPSRESLKRLRELNRARAVKWIGDASRQPTSRYDCKPLDTALPLSPAQLDHHRARVLQELEIPAEDDAYEDSYYGTKESISLLDLLPLFMKVSASCFAIFDVGLSSQWISTAIGLMLQASLEQYLAFGEDGSDAIDEAFAWGYRDDEQDLDGNSSKINRMFEDDQEQGREIQAWQAAKSAALDSLFDHGSQSIVKHFRVLHDAASIKACEENIMDFLKGLSQGIKPVLLQLEQGQLDGMTREETQAFIKSCGVDVMELLGQRA